MAKVICLLVCLALIHTGFALKCYNCVTVPGSTNCDDMSDKDKTAIVPCGNTVPNMFQPACIKKVVENKSTKAVNTTRSCVLLKKDGGSDAECKSASDREEVLACETCTDDLCNNSNQVSTNAYTLAGSVCLYFFVKYLQ